MGITTGYDPARQFRMTFWFQSFPLQECSRSLEQKFLPITSHCDPNRRFDV